MAKTGRAVSASATGAKQEAKVKESVLITILSGIVIAATWFTISHEADQIRLCRSIGHGVMYCTFEFLFSN